MQYLPLPSIHSLTRSLAAGLAQCETSVLLSWRLEDPPHVVTFSHNKTRKKIESRSVVWLVSENLARTRVEVSFGSAAGGVAGNFIS